MATVHRAGAKQKMTELALAFPSLREANGVNPWDVWRLHDWSPTAESRMASYAADFLLAIWDPLHFTEFNVFHALSEWDEAHRRAFAAWASNPYWPRIDWPHEERALT